VNGSEGTKDLGWKCSTSPQNHFPIQKDTVKNGGGTSFESVMLWAYLKEDSNMAKANQHYAVMAVYHTTAKLFQKIKLY